MRAERLPQASAVLRDGRVVALAPILASDAPALGEFLGSLSAESRRLRFLQSTPVVKQWHLRQLTQVDHCTHVAWMATLHGHCVGEVRYVRLADELGDGACAA